MSRELVCMAIWANLQLVAKGAPATLAFDSDGELKAWVRSQAGTLRPWSVADGGYEYVQMAIKQTLQHRWYEPDYSSGSLEAIGTSASREGLLA